MELPSPRLSRYFALLCVFLGSAILERGTAWADEQATTQPTASVKQQAKNQPQADALAAKAKKHFVVGDFREAALVYKEAFQVSSDPTLLLKMGQCYAHLDQPEDWKKAIFILKGFMSYNVQQGDRKLAHQSIKMLQERLKQRQQPNAEPTTRNLSAKNHQPRLSEERIKAPETRRWHSLIEMSAGMALISRSFDFIDPRIPSDPSNYRSGFVPALWLEFDLFPITIKTKRHLSSFGIVAEAWFMLGLQSQLPGYSAALPTTLSHQKIGFRYRWNLLNKASSPTLTMGHGLSWITFNIEWASDQSLTPLPNISYRLFELAAIKLRYPFYTGASFTCGGTASFNYLFGQSTGDIVATDSSGYGDSSTTGGPDFGWGVYAIFHHVSFKLTGFYKHISFDFDGNCYKSGTGCMVAGGALDRYLGASLSVGFSF